MHTAFTSLRSSQGRRLALALPATLLAITALAACGSDDNKSDSTSSASTTSGSSASLLGPEKKATGTPVKVGFAYEGTSAAIDTSNQFKSASAVVQYANDHLGGLGGRPIEIVKCETKGAPATAADCGNQFVQAGVVAVVAGSLGQTDPVIKAINPVGIPMVDILNSSAGFLGSPIDFTMSNALNAYGGPAGFAKKQGLKSAALIVIDVPAAIEPARTIGALLFNNAGAVPNVIGVAPGVADMTPQIQAAEAKNPAMYHILGNPAFCTAAFKALKTLAINKPITTIDRCLDKTGAASIQGGYAGLNVFTPANIDPSTADYKLYAEIMKTYGGVSIDADSTVAYQAMLGFVRAADSGAGLKDVTPAGVIAAIKAMPATDLPLGGGGKFKCDGTALPAISKQICSSQGITGKADKDGKLSDFTLIADPSIYVLPAK
ncbi:MAG: putative branched-chain amino acid transporter, amino acid-binding protein [Frankiales bacterium]|nr:putative branched-chain amino acid transporter, amino acid-binding protein [Frankiales bacterium]